MKKIKKKKHIYICFDLSNGDKTKRYCWCFAKKKVAKEFYKMKLSFLEYNITKPKKYKKTF